MKILRLAVKSNPFQDIRRGHKTEEYREIKPYWNKRLNNHKYTHIEFVNGYSNNSPRFTVRLESIEVGLPNAEFCYGIIDKEKEVYILKLGRIEWTD